MKKIIAIIGLLIFTPIFLTIYEDNVNRYEMDCTVYEIYPDFVTIEDTTGNLWDVEIAGVDKEGIYRVTFNTNGTDTERKDDKVEKIIKKDLTNE